MATSGIRKRVSRRTGRLSYQVWWRMEDGSQGARTVYSRDEARELLDEKRLEMRRGTWRGRQRGRLPFNHWADEWWSDWSADPHRSPNTLVMRRKPPPATTYARSSVTGPSSRIGPADVRRWQAQLARSGRLRHGDAMPVAGAAHLPVRHGRRRDRRQPGPQGAAAQAPGRPRGGLRRGQAPRAHARGSRAAAGLLPPVLVGPRHHPARHRPALRRAGRTAPPPGPPRPRPCPSSRSAPPATRPAGSAAASSRAPRATPASARCPWPRWWSRRSAASSPPAATPRTSCSPAPVAAATRQCARGTRTVLSRHNFRRTYHGAVAKLADPATQLRPTAMRVLKALRDGRPPDRRAARRPARRERPPPIRPATVAARPR